MVHVVVTADHAAGDVVHLNGAALAVDDDLAIADEGEVVAIGVTGAEDQAEAAGVVGGVGFEGVARGSEQVNIVASEVIDKVEVAELNVQLGS